MKYWTALVAEAGARYDGHPFLDSVDISVLSATGAKAGATTCRHFQFQKASSTFTLTPSNATPLLMNFDEPQALAYGTGRGAGCGLDCLGDMGGNGKDRPNFSHMLDFYPQQIARMGIQDVWQRSPVSLENVVYVPPLSFQEPGTQQVSSETGLRCQTSCIPMRAICCG